MSRMRRIKNGYLECVIYEFEEYIRIDKLEVFAEFRNQGVGTHFMKQLIEEYDKDIVLTVLYDRPISFYKRLGFEMESQDTMIFRKGE